MSDPIERQAAIDALGERPVVWSDNDDYTLGERNQYDMDRLAIETVPSSQPDVPDTNVGDMISRQGVLRLLNAVPSEEFATKAMLISGVNALPSAQGWIPCSERLPERYDNYLITTKDEDTDIGTFHPEFKQWSICDADGFMLTDGVLAWQPLPKPWKGENA